MVRRSGDLSVAVLERMLDKKKSTLQVLTSRRDKLQKDLAKVEEKILSLEGRRGGGVSLVRRKRPKNNQSLSAVVTDILSKSRTGYTLSELADKVLATGYKSGSSNFKNVLYQCLYNSPSFTHEAESGTYKLKRTAKPRD